MTCTHPEEETSIMNSDDVPSEMYGFPADVSMFTVNEPSRLFVPCSTVKVCWKCNQVIMQISDEPFESWWPKNKHRFVVS